MTDPRIIVIGGSAGGLEALKELVHDLTADLPAAVCVALHLAPYSPSYLPDILRRSGRLPARHPDDHEPIRPGTIYVAPPDHHLLVGHGFLRVLQGAKENAVRPAIDPLFRTAAVAYGPRVVAVLLSGLLDDGTAGLQAVKACGGVAVVQEPRDAFCPQMLENALQNVAVDHRARIAELAPLLDRLAREPVQVPKGGFPVSDELKFEAKIVEWDLEALKGADRPGKPSAFTCPNCHGDLWEIGEGGSARFRCRTGHAFGPLSLLATQSDDLDRILNEAFRALKEKLHMAQRMARRAREQGNGAAADHYQLEARNAEQYARSIWDMLLRIRRVTPVEPEAGEESVSA